VVGEFIPSDAPEIVLDTNKATDPADLRPLTLHELGHAFRLEHIDHVDSVMFPMANRVQELDPWTLRAFAELRLRSAD
jgi:predicted Zn-dependent protease